MENESAVGAAALLQGKAIEMFTRGKLKYDEATGQITGPDDSIGRLRDLIELFDMGAGRAGLDPEGRKALVGRLNAAFVHFGRALDAVYLHNGINVDGKDKSDLEEFNVLWFAYGGGNKQKNETHR